MGLEFESPAGHQQKAPKSKGFGVFCLFLQLFWFESLVCAFAVFGVVPHLYHRCTLLRHKTAVVTKVTELREGGLRCLQNDSFWSSAYRLS